MTVGVVSLFWWFGTAFAEPWQVPPPEVLAALRAPELPSTRVSPDGASILVFTPVRYPPFSDRAAPFLRLAGHRVDPRTGAHRGDPYAVDPQWIDVATGRSFDLGLDDVHIHDVRWSADGERVALVGSTGGAMGLWTVDRRGAVAAWPDLGLVPLLGDEVVWLPDQRHLVVKRAAPSGPPPATATVPTGPEVREAHDESPTSTYEARDLLVTPEDDALFSWYFTAQLAVVDVETRAVRDLGSPGVFGAVSPSPDGAWLAVERLLPPWSRAVTTERFARELSVWSVAGGGEVVQATSPVADQVPIHGVREGARDRVWDPSSSATLVWTEALDGGDPRAQVAARDRLMRWSAPFSVAPSEWARLPHRVEAVAFRRGGGAIVAQHEWERRWRHVWTVPAAGGGEPWFDHSVNDRYADAGWIVPEVAADGRTFVAEEPGGVYFHGTGASPEGDRPFLDLRPLDGTAPERRFRSRPGSLEQFVAFAQGRHDKLLIRRQSEVDVPNLFLATLGKRIKPATAVGEAAWAREERPVTSFVDPVPELRGITKQIVTYTREDGVPLSFTLYLPVGYTPGERLPTVLYAYPREFSDARTAGMVSGSPHTFERFTGASHLFFLLRGYAVLHNTTMPVVGDPLTAYDTFVDQIVADATAAVDKAVEMGVTDRDRVGVMGHSHGGLMTATLLAHSDLFRAGIARSGAYNHTIRPFGFQSERRTLFEAKSSYLAMSPALFAPDFNEPLLLVHGAADQNPGTLPFQSERLYEAIRGSGGDVRLVMLPFEEHAYASREAVEHVLWEQVSWFDRYVKGAAPREAEPPPPPP